MMKIKELLIKLEEAENKSNLLLDAAWENEEIEEKFDEAYKEEFKIYNELATELKKLLKIDDVTTRTMIKGKRKELKNILGIA